MDAKRQQLARDFCEAIEHLALEAEAAGELVLAIHWWFRLNREEPFNSRAAISLARALLASEDRGGALKVLEEHQQVLRRELSADTGAQVRELLRETRVDE